MTLVLAAECGRRRHGVTARSGLANRRLQPLGHPSFKDLAHPRIGAVLHQSYTALHRSTDVRAACALLAFARAERMPGEIVTRIDTALADRSAYVPAVVALEIAQKCSRGRFQLLADASARAWYERTLQRFPSREVPISASIALAAYELPELFHKDPADRLIVATARLLDCPVVTVDELILAYGRGGHVHTLAY